MFGGVSVSGVAGQILGIGSSCSRSLSCDSISWLKAEDLLGDVRTENHGAIGGVNWCRWSNCCGCGCCGARRLNVERRR